jgi:DNA-binding winged helix-turn-helix (wHTH) protein
VGSGRPRRAPAIGRGEHRSRRAILLTVRYSFADIVMDTDRFVLERDGVDVRVEPQVFDVLAHLVERRDRVVLKTELLEHV